MRRQTYRNRSLRTSAGRLTEAWRPGVMIWIWQALRNGLTRRREGDHFPKIQAGSLFLGLRWLDTALDFPSTRSTPSQAPSSRSTPGHPHGNKTSWATAELGLSLDPLSAFKFQHFPNLSPPTTRHPYLPHSPQPPSPRRPSLVSCLSTQSPYLREFPTSGFRFKYDSKGLASIPRLGEGRI
jgi:hypothetical protein